MADDWDDHMSDVEYSLRQFVSFAADYAKMSKSNKFEERVQRANERKNSFEIGKNVLENTKINRNNFNEKVLVSINQPMLFCFEKIG
ncbi:MULTISPECIES: hypothetical protein [unclassified Enterococcus]|uniref:hypothetical protein n=1 Tax=unclassified Enterococcus TaxID=2608891 RepID=UPI0013ED082F|nr:MULTISPECIES: hypothetical protein [unclassified Enterococcus]